jgi:hypothetical protein
MGGSMIGCSPYEMGQGGRARKTGIMRGVVLLSGGAFLRRGFSAVKNLPDPGCSVPIPFCNTLENDIHLLVPATLYEGREWTVSDAVGGGGGRQPC